MQKRYGFGKKLILISLVVVVSVFLFSMYSAPVFSEEFFEKNKDKMQTVVEMVKTGRLQPVADGSASYRLPLGYRALSDRGRIRVSGQGDSLEVMFICGYGIMGEVWEAYVYSEGAADKDLSNGSSNWKMLAHGG